jgi:hypothetical protein
MLLELLEVPAADAQNVHGGSKDGVATALFGSASRVRGGGRFRAAGGLGEVRRQRITQVAARFAKIAEPPRMY